MPNEVGGKKCLTRKIDGVDFIWTIDQLAGGRDDEMIDDVDNSILVRGDTNCDCAVHDVIEANVCGFIYEFILA